MKYVAPSVHLTAFNCPHCGVLTTQTWFSSYASRIGDGKIPQVETEESIADRDWQLVPEEHREPLRRYLERLAQGRPSLVDVDSYSHTFVENLAFSKCYECGEVAVWLHDRLLWPHLGEGPEPNPDLPTEVRQDYDEASTILDLSPRGAAALLRLALQKLCVHLGGKGENLNDDIGALVAKGLDVRVQRALDIVRVIGNNAVHPGQIDLRDERATAEELFRLVNLIADIMITQAKHLDEMYTRLPEGAREAIEKRDSASKTAASVPPGKV